MPAWIAPALDTLPRWLEFQVRANEVPGCALAVAHKGKVVLERAFGLADLKRGEPLTPRHRFRVASHSKTFTATAIMKLRDEDRLRLDDRAGEFVTGLHPAIARATIAQLLSHSAGIVRDGTDAGQWLDRRPFLNEDELRTALAEPPTLTAGTRFKYSNHGFGLAGLVIEAVTGEPYAQWVAREVVEAAGLKETYPDMPLPRGVSLASGHSGKLPLGRRIVIPGRNPTNALASATGFVSTAGDLARFFAQLDPAAARSVISRESRREMTRRHWREEHSSLHRNYGLGTISGRTAGWNWFGHSGGFQGFITRTATLPEAQLTVSILTNAIDGPANPWLDGALHILRAYARHGAPSARTRAWTGRWWTAWTCADLVPVGDRVLVALPALLNPLLDASEVVVTRSGRRAAAGRIALAGGFASHGEPARLERDGRGRASALWLGGTKLLPEAKVMAEMTKRYQR